MTLIYQKKKEDETLFFLTLKNSI